MTVPFSWSPEAPDTDHSILVDAIALAVCSQMPSSLFDVITRTGLANAFSFSNRRGYKQLLSFLKKRMKVTYPASRVLRLRVWHLASKYLISSSAHNEMDAIIVCTQ